MKKQTKYKTKKRIRRKNPEDLYENRILAKNYIQSTAENIYHKIEHIDLNYYSMEQIFRWVETIAWLQNDMGIIGKRMPEFISEKDINRNVPSSPSGKLLPFGPRPKKTR